MSALELAKVLPMVALLALAYRLVLGSRASVLGVAVVGVILVAAVPELWPIGVASLGILLVPAFVRGVASGLHLAWVQRRARLLARDSARRSRRLRPDMEPTAVPPPSEQSSDEPRSEWLS